MPTIDNIRPQRDLSGAARQLVADGLIEPEQALELSLDAERDADSFVARVVSSHTLGAAVLAKALARAFGVPLLDLRAVDFDQAPIDIVPETLIRKHQAIPIFRQANTLHIALADPTDLAALDEFRFKTGLQAEAVLVEQDKLERAINAHYSALDSAVASLDDVAVTEGYGGDSADMDVTGGDADDAPVVRFVNKVLLDAINRGASDIHFEPYEKHYRVRLRQDGVLREVANPPPAIGMRLAARIKVLARLDLAERRIPQDGRIKLAAGRNRMIDFRVSTCPTLHGEKIVLRILDPMTARMGIEALGYEPAQRELFERTVHKPYGMVLVTGPTGSGKTVSLYTALNILNTSDRNISTAEDPAEINLPGINQVSIQPRVGLTFAACLRAFLRQDPDVIMVGEIRDLETAEIAIKAAQTGHMVLSTLHTNDAPQTLTRLLNMGIPAYNIAASVTLIIAQRLARRLCPHCRRTVSAPAEALVEEGFVAEEIAHLTLYEAHIDGCDHCTHGYRGRVGIFQVMPVTDAIGEIIMNGGTARDIEVQAEREGVLDLRAAGLNKVREGLIGLAELDRVTLE